MRFSKKQTAQRYRLHHRIRKQGYKLRTRERTIYVGIDAELTKQCIKLRDEFGYTIQTGI